MTLVERNLAHEEEKKERKLCKMGIYLYSSVFHNIFNFFSDSVSRYGKVSFFEYYRSGIKQIGPNFVGWANYAELLKSDMITYGKNTLILWVIGFIPQIVVALVLANWFTDARLKIHKLQFFKVVIYLPNLIMASAFALFVLYTVLEQWSCELNPAVYGSDQQAYRLYGKCIWNQITHRLHEFPYVVR